MISSNLLINLNNNLTAMSKFNNQISTGKVISRPSDDPVIAAKALKLRTDLSELEQYGKNTNDALSWVDITESAIKEYNSILQRIRELTVSASNGDKTIDDNKKISEEIKQLKEQLISIGNTTYAGRSVFTGFQTDKKLFDENGNYKVNVTSEYINNRKYTNYEVGINEEIRVNTYGIDLFGYVDKNDELDSFPTGEATGEKAVGGKLTAQDTFDFSEYLGELTDETIEITVEGDTFTVPTSELQKINGETTEKKDIIDILSNATNVSGGALKYSADIYFDNDKLVIASRDAYGPTSNITLEYKGTDRNLLEDVFGLDDKVAVGEAAKSAILESEYPVKLNEDYADPVITDETITVTVDGTVYTISDTALKGLGASQSETDILTLFRNASDGGGATLDDVADISFENGRLVIKADSTGVGSTIQVAYTGTNPTVLQDRFFLSTVGVTGTDATKGIKTGENPVDLGADFSSGNISDVNMVITIGNTDYTITTAEFNSLPSPLNVSQMETFLNTQISGSDATASIDGSGNLVITADNPGQVPISVTYTGDDAKKVETIMGIEDKYEYGKDAVDAVIVAPDKVGIDEPIATGVYDGITAVDLKADFSSEAITNEYMQISIDNVDFRIPASSFNSLPEPPTMDDIKTLIENADTVPSGTLLSTMATVTDVDGKIKITATTPTHEIKTAYVGEDPENLETVMGMPGRISKTLPGDSTKSIYSGQKMFVHLGDERKEITLGDIPADADANDIITAMQTAMDTAFGAGKINVSLNATTEKIEISTNNTNDGTIPELFVDYERATESRLFEDIDEAIIAMESGDQKGIEEFLGKMDGHLATTHAVWADVGARYNRLELINNRIDTNEVTYTKLLSLNEDVNQSEAIMNFKNQENVYRASLSMGSKIIQPSLVDFIK